MSKVTKLVRGGAGFKLRKSDLRVSVRFLSFQWERDADTGIHASSLKSSRITQVTLNFCVTALFVLIAT